MKLIVISSPDHFKQEAEIINLLFQSGLKHFHLRKPGWSVAEIANLLENTCPKYYEKIVIHDHFQLALDYGLRGIHYTAKTKDRMDQWLSFQGSQSTSCHNLLELEQLPEQINYAFLSPIFPSISKSDYKANFEMEELQRFSNSYKKTEVVALGGIEVDKLQTCRQLGFEAVAVLGSIWQQGHLPEAIVDQFLCLKEKSYRLYKNVKNLDYEGNKK